MSNYSKARESLKNERELARLQREEDWKAVLSTPEGERVMGYLMQESGYHGVFYGGMDTHYTAFHEGRRSIGQFIVRQVQVAAPERVSVIMMGGLNESRSSDSNNSDDRSNNGW